MIIDCDICGDMIETTAKVIVTPFECDACKDNGDGFPELADVELVQDLQQQLADALKGRDEAQAWETKSHRYLALALERVEEDTKVIEGLKNKIAHLEISNTILNVTIDGYEDLLGYART